MLSKHVWSIGLALLTALVPALAAASGLDPTRISLPQGPASIGGLGSNFAPSLASGTAAEHVDIRTPPSVGAFAPTLSLSYDAGTGVSELGMGWKLAGPPSIRRRIEQGLPRFDETDSFELVGLGMPSDLLKMPDGYYRPEQETGTFVRVQRSKDGAEWEARDKRGITYRFGGEGFEEREGTLVATYLIHDQVDLHGHSIRYQWDTREGHALLTTITWNDLADSATNQITLGYQSRPDTHELFSCGIRQLLTRRVASIDVTQGGELVYRYSLNYEAHPHTLLVGVKLFGADGATALPPLTYSYTEPTFAAADQLVTMRSPPGRSPGNDAELADLNGDGLPDLLVGTAGKFRSYINRDGLTWDEGRDWDAGSSPSVSLSAQGVQLADLDADGAIDLVVKSGTDAFRYLPMGAERFRQAVPIATVPTFSFEDENVRLADLDGDRRTDVIVTTLAGVAIGYNLDGRDWTEPKILGKVDAKQPLLFADKKTSLCDVNGDRIQDFCYLRSGSLVYWLGRGRGAFADAREANGVPAFDEADAWKIVDLNGDGWADLVHVGIDTVSLALATGAGSFDKVRAIDAVPKRKPGSTVVEFADLNASGTIDIVWIDTTGVSQGSWQYLELFPSGRAGLLQRIDNGVGKRTTIDYEPAAMSAARARTAGHAWSARMNVPMAVVRRVTVDSSLGDPQMVTEYDYAEGTWDPAERTFAGFAEGSQADLGDDATPTRITTTTFDPGVEVRVLRGALRTKEERDANGKLFSRASNTYTTSTTPSAVEGRQVSYAYVSAERVEISEGTKVPAVTLTERVQDEFGCVIKLSEWGQVVDGDKYAGNDERITITTYARDVGDWLLDADNVATQEVQDSSGKRLSLKRNYYDGAAFVGLPLGKLTRGDLIRAESWIEAKRFADDARMEVDEDGNPITVLTARGGKTQFEFDPESHTFVLRETRQIESGAPLSWSAEYDRRRGLVTEMIGPNGERQSYRYDALGRVTDAVLPGDTVDRPTQHYTYELGAPLSRLTTEQRQAANSDRAMTVVSLVDGLGRTRGTFQRAEAGNWALSGLTSFDARGEPAFAAFPSFADSVELPPIKGLDGTWSSRDPLGRQVQTKNVGGSVTRVEYAPFEHTVWDENDTDRKSPHYNTPTTHVSDGLGRARELIEREADKKITSGTYAYDAIGNLTSISDAAGSVRGYEYDGRSRRVSIDDPNAGKWTLVYTDGNDLERRVDPTGRTVRYVHDTVGRVVEEWHQLGLAAPEVLAKSYHYDEAAPEHAELANLRGRLAWVEDAAGKVFFGYDARGRETSRVRRWRDGTEHRTWAEFDSADRQVVTGYPDGTFTRQEYNERGLLSHVGPFVTDLKWNAAGQVLAMRLGNGIVDSREYDARLRLDRLFAKTPEGTSVRDLQYTFDDASRITAITDRRPDVSNEQSVSASFVFDDRYRLRTETDTTGTTKWSYDDVGKITSVSSNHETAALNVTNQYGERRAGPDQLTHHGDEGWKYDAAGRVTSDGVRNLEWDAKGRLSRVTRGDTVEDYTYGFDDARAIKLTAGGGTPEAVRYISEDVEEREGKLVRYVFVGGERIARLDPLPCTPAGAVAAPTSSAHATVDASVGRSRMLSIICAMFVLLALLLASRLRGVWNLGRACAALTSLLLIVSFAATGCSGSEAAHPAGVEISTVPASAVFYLSDLQHSPLAVSNARAKTVSSTSYFPYGVVRTTQSAGRDPFSFLGNEQDRGSGLGDFHARPYRTDAAVFLAPDPVAVFSPEAAIGAPEHLYAYAYAAGDPINGADPSGQIIETLWDIANVVLDVASGVHNIATGQYAAAAVDAGCLVVDVFAVAIPGVPGGAGTAIKAVRLADRANEAIHIAKAADKVVEGARAAEKVREAAQAGERVVEAAKAAEKAAAPTRQKTYQTYKKPHPTKPPYIGRTSGTGTPLQNVNARDSKDHHMNAEGFGPAVLDKSSTDKNAIRGREQHQIDANGGARSRGGTSSNAIDGIAQSNANRQGYLDAAEKEFGR